MSHLFIVQGRPSQSTERLFNDGISLFESLWKARPCDSVAGATLSVCSFPRQNLTSNLIARAPNSARWACGSGTWFYQGVSGQPGLQKLLVTQFLPDPPASSLRDLDGQFVVVSGDADTGDCTVITDRLGILHVYTVQIGDSRAFSTSSLVLAALAGAAPDPEGCRQLIASGNLFEPARSLFTGVQKLEEARVYHSVDGRLMTERRYWSIASAVGGGNEPVNVSRVAAALQDALHMVRHNFSSPLMDFTGGFDTRGLVGAMLSANLDLDLVVNGPDDSADVISASRIAQGLGLRLHHRFRTFRSLEDWWERAKQALLYTDGECDVLQYAHTLQTHLDNAGFDSSVNGAIGEVLKGHWWELLFPYTGWRHHFDPHLIASRRFTFEGEVRGLFACPFPGTLTDHYADVIRQTVNDLQDFPNTVLLDAVYLILRQQKWLGRTVSATDRIFPCVSPYGFRQPLELAVSAPARAKMHHRMSRRLIEYEDRRLSQFPLPGGFPAMPLRITTAHRFWPVLERYSRLVTRRVLIQAKLRSRQRNISVLYRGAAFPLGRLAEMDEVRTLLDPAQMHTRDLFEARVLRQQLDACLSETSANSYRMGRILTLELAVRAANSARKELRGSGVVSMAS